MKYIVFETIDLTNGKIYIGIHKTADPDVFDGYIGDGINIKIPNTYNKARTALQSAVQRHGVNSFKRITLKTFKNMSDATTYHAMIVNSEFVSKVDNYNSVACFNHTDMKSVHIFDLNGIHLMECKSIIDAANYLDITKERVLLSINERVNYKKYYLSYDEEIDPKLYSEMPIGAIAQYNRDGVMLNSFRDIPAAATALDIPRDAIARAVSMRATCSGYRFMRVDEDINKVLGKKSAIELTTTVPVYRYKTTGEFDAEFESVKEAAANTPNISTGKIIRAIKMNRVCRGYRWSYNRNEEYVPTNKPKARKVEKYVNGKLVKLYQSTKEMPEEEIEVLRGTKESDAVIKYKKLS